MNMEEKMELKDNTYSVFIIDPPWNQKKGGLRKSRPNQQRALDYDVMDSKGIFNLLDKEIFSLAEDTHTVFMWTIEKYLLECEKLMEERGYRRHIRMIWDKRNGIAPAFTLRFSHEYLIWYYKPKMLPINKEMRGKHLSVFNESPRQHSRKPDIAYDIIDSLYPNEKKIDVFSREKRNGYDQFGNEINFFV